MVKICVKNFKRVFLLMGILYHQLFDVKLWLLVNSQVIYYLKSEILLNGIQMKNFEAEIKKKQRHQVNYLC